MARPAYIICSLSGSSDQFNGRTSCFDVIDTVAVRKITKDEKPSPLKIRVVAAWIRDAGDEDKKYQGELRLKSDEAPMLVAKFDGFLFTQAHHRLIIPELPLMGFPSLGVVTIECRIRQVGSEDWKSQCFSFVTHELQPDVAQ